MLVSERMSRNPITVAEDTPIPEALKLMRDRKVRRLPVVNQKGKLVGIISEKDLLYASPSPATTLSIYEMQYLLSKITVKEVMTTNVFTVCEDCPIEEAARQMVDHKIGGVPVMRGDQLVGIITETDLFKTFLELLGGRAHGVRITLIVPEVKGILARLTDAIAKQGGNIISLGTFLGSDAGRRQITLKVADVDQETLTTAIRDIAVEVVDVRVV
jgi:acetoin utilization protein AcuB